MNNPWGLVKEAVIGVETVSAVLAATPEIMVIGGVAGGWFAGRKLYKDYLRRNPCFMDLEIISRAIQEGKVAPGTEEIWKRTFRDIRLYSMTDLEYLHYQTFEYTKRPPLKTDPISLDYYKLDRSHSAVGGVQQYAGEGVGPQETERDHTGTDA